MHHEADRPAARVARAHPVWWIIAVSLAVIALHMTFGSGDSGFPVPAMAQSVGSAGARGIFAFSGQLTPGTHGVYMVDVDAGTIWCYEYVQLGATRGLRLASARSWIFDRYLEDYNTDEPSSAEIEQLVKQQRASKQTSSGTP